MRQEQIIERMCEIVDDTGPQVENMCERVDGPALSVKTVHGIVSMHNRRRLAPL